MARERSRTSVAQGMGEDNHLEIGGRENAGMDTNVGIAEEQSKYAHSKLVL